MKNIILKERNTGLLLTVDPKEIDLTELAVEIISANNVIVSLGDSYEVVSVKSKKEAETALENIKSTIMKLKVDNEEENAVSSTTNPNTDKILNVLGKVADLISPILNNDSIFEFLSEYIEDAVSDAFEKIIESNSEEEYEEEEEVAASEEETTIQEEEKPKKVPLVTFSKDDTVHEVEVKTVTMELDI